MSFYRVHGSPAAVRQKGGPYVDIKRIKESSKSSRYDKESSFRKGIRNRRDCKMMSDGLAYRHDYHEQPPRVEYGLTELGTKMLPIVNSLADFGNYYKSIIEQN